MHIARVEMGNHLRSQKCFLSLDYMLQEESSQSKITGKQVRRPTDKSFLELELVPHIHGQKHGGSDKNPSTLAAESHKLFQVPFQFEQMKRLMKIQRATKNRGEKQSYLIEQKQRQCLSGGRD